MPFSFFKKKEDGSDKKSDKPDSSEVKIPEYKVAVFGDVGCGKTQIIQRLIGKEFDPSLQSTIGFVFWFLFF